MLLTDFLLFSIIRYDKKPMSYIPIYFWDRLLFKKLEKYGPITSQGFAQKSTKPLNSNTAHKISNCVNTNNSNLHISIYRISVIRCVKNCTCSGTFTQ